MAATAMAATTMKSTCMESAKGMTAAEVSSRETMADEVVSPIVGAEVTKKPVADVGAVKRSNNSIPGASAKHKDGGSSY
jgi:hypothetical protein